MDYRVAPPNAPLLVVSSNVVALDRATGQQRWIYSLGGETARRYALDGERIFVFDSESRVHCLDVATGTCLGVVTLTSVPDQNTMLLDGDRLYVGGSGRIAALDRNGNLLWEVSVPPSGRRSLAGLAIPGGSMVQVDFSGA
jgi:outer membrane protein assembly factor BamB